MTRIVAAGSVSVVRASSTWERLPRLRSSRSVATWLVPTPVSANAALAARPSDFRRLRTVSRISVDMSTIDYSMILRTATVPLA